MNTVSYTHLDVYKRQRLSLLERCVTYNMYKIHVTCPNQNTHLARNLKFVRLLLYKKLTPLTDVHLISTFRSMRASNSNTCTQIKFQINWNLGNLDTTKIRSLPNYGWTLNTGAVIDTGRNPRSRIDNNFVLIRNFIAWKNVFTSNRKSTTFRYL